MRAFLAITGIGLANCLGPTSGSPLPQTRSSQLARLDVPLITDEADAVLSILSTLASGSEPSSAQWGRVFSSEGYIRLQQRERSMNRPFEDSTFRAFVLSDTLLKRAPALERTLAAWKKVNLSAAARRAFAYLPPNARIRAKVYPVIKPRTNSFVFEPRTNPAIFLYVDPQVSASKFENTLAHELHHIGVASACADRPSDSTRSENLRTTLAWMGGFAEGRAVLAAAGMPEAHPHASSNPGERAIWDRDIVKVSDDLKRMETFYLALLGGQLSEQETTRRGMELVNTDSVPQGPFYTVGWLMAATIEKMLGRERLVASVCDPVMFVTDYNEAAAMVGRSRGESHPAWSTNFLDRLKASSTVPVPF